MPPEAPDVLQGLPPWIRLATEVGLIGWLGLSIWALLKRWVITRETYLEERADEAERLAYVEARRVEERAGRIAAEKRVSDLTERWERGLTLLANIEKELIRGGRDRDA